MPSSFSFLLNSPSNSSSSSLENVSKSDQSDDDHDINVNYYEKRTMPIDNDMLEQPSDHDDSYSQSDVTDHDDHIEKKPDRFTPATNPRSVYLTRQSTFYDDEWPKKTSIEETKSQKIIHDHNEATLSSGEHIDPNQHRAFSPERSKSGTIVDKKYQSRNVHTPLPNDFLTTSVPESEHRPETTTTPLSQTTMNKNTRHPLSKIPIRANSSSQSRSRSPTFTAAKNRRTSSPKTPSKIPVPVSTTTAATTTTIKGAFHFFSADDRSSLPQPHPTTETAKVKSQITNQQISPFTPITHRKIAPTVDKTTSSAGHTPTAKYSRQPTTISDGDDDDSETTNLKEDDLKLKLKEQKRYGRRTGELLDKLHENYEELLEKYAQAENTIDQLRFQPKIFGENTPSSNASEGVVHFVHQPKVSIPNLRSSGVYHSTTVTPLSSIIRATSTTTTTANTPAPKSTSPANSGTVESVFFDEIVPQKITVEELSTPETVKVDLLIQTKTLGGKMKSFLTLMGANQLSLAEQKQVYETIKDDYEKLLKVFDRNKHGGDFSDIDFDADLNTELEMMKQLLKEIVTRITENLYGKSSNGIESDRQSRITQSETHSSARSSICNHTDLMDQYHKLLNAVNAGIVEKKNDARPLQTGSEIDLEQMKKTSSRILSQSDISNPLSQTTKNQKRRTHLSGNSDDEQVHRSNDNTPVELTRVMRSTPLEQEYTTVAATTTTTKHPQRVNEEQTHKHDIKTPTTKKTKTPSKRELQEYDNLENITKSTRKTKTDLQRATNSYEPDHGLSPSSLSVATAGAHYSTRSMRTRTSDYDSGIGTNNTTKLSRDSKLNISTTDETHYQSLDDDKRRYTDEEQESMSRASTSYSSGSGDRSPENSYDKSTKRFDTFSSSRPLNEKYRRKPHGNADVYPSDHDTLITGPFSTSSTHHRKPRHSYPNTQTQQSIAQRSRLTPFHRSISIESLDIENHTPQIATRETTHQPQMARKYQSGFIHRQATPSTHPETIYRSACYIDQPHTHRRPQETIEQNPRQHYKPPQSSTTKQANNLYLDPQTGVVYQYVSNKTQPSNITHYQVTSRVKSSNAGLYKCAECGCMTTYHHRHHIHSTTRRTTNDVDDPGYESGNRRINRHRQYVEHGNSSDSDLDDNLTHYDMSILNEAFERARKVQHRSQTLSRHISRQLKLVLTTI